MTQSKRSRYLSTINISARTLMAVLAVGFGVGVAIWLLSLALQAVVIEPVFCRSADSFRTCANGGTVSLVFAQFIASMFGLFLLVRLNVYRPLLVIIASIAGLYGVNVWLGWLNWYEATLIYGLLVALSYMVYAWIARLVSFALALFLTIALTVALQVFVIQA